jgi:hypothetical protein
MTFFTPFLLRRPAPPPRPGRGSTIHHGVVLRGHGGAIVTVELPKTGPQVVTAIGALRAGRRPGPASHRGPPGRGSRLHDQPSTSRVSAPRCGSFSAAQRIGAGGGSMTSASGTARS